MLETIATFALVATLWTSPGNGEQFVLDYDMSATDCLGLALDMVAERATIEIAPGHVVTLESVTLACEIEGENV